MIWDLMVPSINKIIFLFLIDVYLGQPNAKQEY